MATKAAAAASGFEELSHHAEGVSLCLLVNRRARSMRVIDFRSGPQPAKRQVVVKLARREGVDRIFTLVERDEVSTWTRIGFAREGNIPGFYKRSDAWILGTTLHVLDDDPEKSGLRLAVAPAIGEAEPPGAERLYQAARKAAKEHGDEALPQVRLQALPEAEVPKRVVAAGQRAITRFEPFGRDVLRTHYVASTRGGFTLPMSVERQVCFDNAFIELLQGPRGEKEILATRAAIRQLCAHLQGQGVVGTFALAPTEDSALGAAYLSSGFRRTGQLVQHLYLAKRRVDAFVWSRKLAQLPGEE